jgi:hypothetical protein
VLYFFVVGKTKIFSWLKLKGSVRLIKIGRGWRLGLGPLGGEHSGTARPCTDLVLF